MPRKGQKVNKRMNSESELQTNQGGTSEGIAGQGSQHASSATPGTADTKTTRRKTMNKNKAGQHRSQSTPGAGGELVMSPEEGFELFSALKKIAVRNKHLGTRAIRAGVQSIAQTAAFV